MNHRRPRFSWIFIIGIIVGVVLYSLISKPKRNTPEAKANEFLREYYTIINTDIAELMENPIPIDPAIDENSHGIDEVAGFKEALQNKYGELMTDRGLETAAANRVIPAGELAARKFGSKLYLIDTGLIEDKAGNEDIRYMYNITAIVSLEDGTKEFVSLDGNLNMKKIDGKWKVDRFSPSRGQLTRILEMGVPYLYIINDSDGIVKKVELRYKLNTAGAMNADGETLKKGDDFKFEMNNASNLDFTVLVFKDEENLLIKQDFTKDFSNGKDVFLFIREDSDGNFILVDDTHKGAMVNSQKLLKIIEKIEKGVSRSKFF